MGAHEFPPRETRWYFFQDESGGWRWDAVAADGAVIASSAAAFASRQLSVQDATERGYAVRIAAG